MKHLILTLVTFLSLSFTLTGCFSGGGGTNVAGTVHFSHSQLAREFVRRMELDLGYELDLVKINTRQYDYLVVYNYDSETYDALWIGNYEVGENLANYLERYNDRFYLDLDFIGYDSLLEPLYQDFYSELIFEDTYAASRSSSSVQSHLSRVFNQAKSKRVADKYGLSRQRAGELVTLAMHYKALGRKGALTEEEYDAFSMEAMGTSASELIRVAKENDVIGGLKALKRAADKNGIGVEHAQSLLTKEFGLEL